MWYVKDEWRVGGKGHSKEALTEILVQGDGSWTRAGVVGAVCGGAGCVLKVYPKEVFDG